MTTPELPDEIGDEPEDGVIVATYLVKVTCRSVQGWIPATLTNSQVEAVVNEAVARATGLAVRSKAERTDK